MNRVLVATVDGVKARFFRLAPVDPASADGRVCLVEWRTEANLEHGLSGRELFSDTRSGGNRSTAGGGTHAYADHRASHRADAGRRFAARVAAVAGRSLRDLGASQLLVVASPTMLGLLRPALAPLRKRDVTIREFARDVTMLDAPRLQVWLEQAELIPSHVGESRPSARPTRGGARQTRSPRRKAASLGDA